MEILEAGKSVAFLEINVMPHAIDRIKYQKLFESRK